MFKIFNKKQNYNNKIIFISPDINSGGSENILFNLAQTKNKNDILLISLTDIGYYGSILKKEGYKILNWLKILNYIYNKILEVKNWKNYTQIFWIQLMVLKKP